MGADCQGQSADFALMGGGAQSPGELCNGVERVDSSLIE